MASGRNIEFVGLLVIFTPILAYAIYDRNGTGIITMGLVVAGICIKRVVEHFL